MTPLEEYRALSDKIKACSNCPLCATRYQVVVDRGNPESRLMLIGEAPGANEDAQGEAFVGRAGQLLDQLLAEAGISDFVIVNVIKCVSGKTLVRMPDGRTERINKLVKDRYSGEVLSVDPDSGEICSRRVTGWYRSSRGNRQMLKLRYEHGKGGPIGPAVTYLTADHRVLTESGWVEAGRVEPGTKIATGEVAPGLRTEQLIYGTMLGDAAISEQLRLQHCVRQAEWLGLKASILSLFSPTVASVPQNNSVGLHTRASSYWRALREKFYSGNSKVVPSDIDDHLTDFLIAVWFMDNGYLRIRPNRRPAAEIASNGFSKTDVDRLVCALSARGLKCRARFGAGWRIFFAADATHELSRRIASMVPECLRYKLHPDHRSIPFDPSWYEPEPVRTFFDTAIIEPGETAFTRREKSLYCIDVEGTNAFITPGGVVHNCRPPENKFPGDAGSQHKEDIVNECLPWLDAQLELIRPKAILLVGHKAVRWTIYRGHKIVPPMKELAGKWLRSEDYRNVDFFVMYHTSYLLRTQNMDKARAEGLRELTVSAMHRAKDVLDGELPDGEPIVVSSGRQPPNQEQLRFF